MRLDEVFDIVRSKRLMVVSTVDSAGRPEAALMGFACTPQNEFVFDTLSTARKSINLASSPAIALVIGWDDNISVQIEGDARRPVGEDLAAAKAAYFRQWPDGRDRENWPNIAYFVVRPRWIRYSNYTGAPVIEEFTL